MADNDTPKHRMHIKEKGRIAHEGIVVEVHSRGGSLFGLKSMIDEFSMRQSLGIRTAYDNKSGAGYLSVIFADDNALSAAEKLDMFFSDHEELQILGYFGDAVEAAYAHAPKGYQSH